MAEQTNPTRQYYGLENAYRDRNAEALVRIIQLCGTEIGTLTDLLRAITDNLQKLNSKI